MGRKTWDSIPLKFRPLRDRTNIVLSRTASGTSEATWCKSLPDALTVASQIQETVPIHRTFIIGGATIYEEALKSLDQPTLVDRILLTRILSPEFEECNVFFPKFSSDSAEWQQSSSQELQEWLGFEVPSGVQKEKGVEYEFQMWVRRMAEGDDEITPASACAWDSFRIRRINDPCVSRKHKHHRAV